MNLRISEDTEPTVIPLLENYGNVAFFATIYINALIVFLAQEKSNGSGPFGVFAH